MTISDEALAEVKARKREIVAKFANIDIFQPTGKPGTTFMAGSPGAGKTEFSLDFIKETEKSIPNQKIVRIDADEIRMMLSQYRGGNAHEIQSASIKGVDMLYDHVIRYNQSALVDGTFRSYPKALQNIKRALNHGRSVGIFYIYQDPLIAWDFTQKREVAEGRRIKKSDFIYCFVEAKDTVDKIKSIFKGSIRVDLIVKDYTNHEQTRYLDVPNIDSCIVFKYTVKSLEKLIK